MVMGLVQSDWQEITIGSPRTRKISGITLRTDIKPNSQTKRGVAE
jgi:hypothetical protein